MKEFVKSFLLNHLIYCVEELEYVSLNKQI